MGVIVDNCSKCGKRDFRYRLKTKDYVCNKCGNIWKEEEEKIDG